MTANPHRNGFWTDRPSFAELRKRRIEQVLGQTVQSQHRPMLRHVAFAEDVERRKLLDRMPLADLRRVWELGCSASDDTLKDGAELARQRREDGLVPKSGLR